MTFLSKNDSFPSFFLTIWLLRLKPVGFSPNLLALGIKTTVVYSPHNLSLSLSGPVIILKRTFFLTHAYEKHCDHLLHLTTPCPVNTVDYLRECSLISTCDTSVDLHVQDTGRRILMHRWHISCPWWLLLQGVARENGRILGY